MLFSVILPIYNVEKYLNQCVDSVLCQTFTDYELILVDDGSKDSSGQICDEYAKKDDRIKVIHKENGGLSDARNVGTKNAVGDYIIYIDSDDFITTDSFLSDIAKKINITDSDIVLYKYAKYYEDKGLQKCLFSLDFVDEIFDGNQLLYELVKNDAYYGMAWVKAFRREIVINNNIEFEKGLLGEDMDWFFSLLMASTKISAIDRSYIAYRQREGSITSSHKIKNLTDFIYIIEKWSKTIKESNIDKTKKLALFGALAKYYSNLLITYIRLKDKNKKKYLNRIKDLSYLLDFGLSPRPVKINKMYKMLGFKGLLLMLKVYDLIK